MSLIPRSDGSDRLPMDRTAMVEAERYIWAWVHCAAWDTLTRMVRDLHAYATRLERRTARAEHERDQARSRVAELEAELALQEELPLGAVPLRLVQGPDQHPPLAITPAEGSMRTA